MYSSVVGGGAGGDREELITSQRQCKAWLSKTHDHQGDSGGEGAGGGRGHSCDWGGLRVRERRRFQHLLDFECWMSHCSVMSMLSFSLQETE